MASSIENELRELRVMIEIVAENAGLKNRLAALVVKRIKELDAKAAQSAQSAPSAQPAAPVVEQPAVSLSPAKRTRSKRVDAVEASDVS